MEDAPRQNWEPDRYAANARFVADLGAPALELLAPRPGERILDLGCGDGALTERLAALGCTVIGIDAGLDVVAAARRRGLEAYVADGEDLRFMAEFDAVFSNAALHWMRDADAVLQGVRRALKHGGRFVGEFGGHGKVAAITVALVAVLTRRGVDGHAVFPWHFPSAEAYAAKLEAHGFAVDQIELLPRPTSGARRATRCWPCWHRICATNGVDGPRTALRGPSCRLSQRRVTPGPVCDPCHGSESNGAKWRPCCASRSRQD